MQRGAEPTRSEVAADGPGGVSALGDEEVLGLALISVLAEHAGGLLVGAGVELLLPAEPLATGGPVPDLDRLVRADGREPFVGEAGEGVMLGPVPDVVGERGRRRAGQVDVRA